MYKNKIRKMRHTPKNPKTYKCALIINQIEIENDNKSIKILM